MVQQNFFGVIVEEVVVRKKASLPLAVVTGLPRMGVE